MIKRNDKIDVIGKAFRLHAFAIIALSFAFSSVIPFSCSIDDLGESITSTGPNTIETREIAFYDSIELYNNINIVLEPGSENTIRVQAGENELPFIKTVIANNTLMINNTMKFNWLRDYSREITVYIPSNNLKKIRYEGSGDITSSGTLKVESLDISAWGGSGDITVDVECYKLNLALHYGTVKFDVKGKSAMTTIFANSYGPFYCNKLISDIVFIRNCGLNDCFVHATTTLDAEVSSVGNIYYCGNPMINFIKNGEGTLMRIAGSEN